MWMSVWQQSVLWVTSSILWHVRVRLAGTTYFFENYFKTMFSFRWISVLLITVTFCTYLANIVFWCDLAFKTYYCVLTDGSEYILHSRRHSSYLLSVLPRPCWRHRLPWLLPQHDARLPSNSLRCQQRLEPLCWWVIDLMHSCNKTF